MKTGRIFWGVFFLTVGVLFLGHGLLPVSLDWSAHWRFWPLVLVLMGLSLLLRNHPARWIFTVLAALLLALFVYGIFSFLSPFEWKGARDMREFTDRREVPLQPGITTASLVLEMGAGKCLLSGGGTGLLEASVSSSFGRYLFDQRTEGDAEFLVLRCTSRAKPWLAWRARNAVDIKLSDTPVWRIRLGCGATRADLDLRSSKIEDLRVEAGASDIALQLGANVAETQVHIETGVSAFRIEVPESAGCELRVDAPLTSKRFAGFRKERPGLYRTENFEVALRRILIDVDAGVSSLRVRRYGS
jgi:hypothetical protein